MAVPNLTELVTTTLRNRSKEFADNVTNDNAFFTRLKTRGNIKSTDGGRNITKEIMFAENDNFQFYSGYEVLDISPNDMLTAAEFDWKQAASHVNINGLEMRQNSGASAITKLIVERTNATMSTISNKLSEGIHSDGTGFGGKQIGGLQLLVSTTPTVGTVGGINRANFPFWRNKTFDTTADGSGAASATNIQGYMNTLYNSQRRGNDFPDMLIADANFFGFYQESLQTQQRFTKDTDLSLAGFAALQYNNSDVLLENGSGIPDDRMYFLNTKFLFLEVHPQANMTALPNKTSVNQDAMLIPIIWQGNMTMNNASLQGVMFD